MQNNLLTWVGGPVRLTFPVQCNLLLNQMTLPGNIVGVRYCQIRSPLNVGNCWSKESLTILQTLALPGALSDAERRPA